MKYKDIEDAYRLSCKRNNEANVRIGELLKQVEEYKGTLEYIANGKHEQYSSYENMANDFKSIAEIVLKKMEK